MMEFNDYVKSMDEQLVMIQKLRENVDQLALRVDELSGVTEVKHKPRVRPERGDTVEVFCFDEVDNSDKWLSCLVGGVGNYGKAGPGFWNDRAYYPFESDRWRWPVDTEDK